MQIIQSIQSRIYELRGERVMLDFDLATLYEVETRVLNQTVKRNLRRFPEDFMFQLSGFEWEIISEQIEKLNPLANPSSQFVMIGIPKNRKGKYLPYAFTEQGFGILSGILNSDKAISMNIAIMRAFVQVRKVLLNQGDLREQLKEIKEHLGNHDAQLNQLYDAMENLIDSKASERRWENRERIGFKRTDE